MSYKTEPRLEQRTGVAGGLTCRLMPTVEHHDADNTANRIHAEAETEWRLDILDGPQRNRTFDHAMKVVKSKLDELAQRTDALIEALERKQAEARYRELERMVAEAGARVMRGEVRPTPSTAFRAHLSWRSE